MICVFGKQLRKFENYSSSVCKMSRHRELTCKKSMFKKINFEACLANSIALIGINKKLSEVCERVSSSS